MLFWKGGVVIKQCLFSKVFFEDNINWKEFGKDSHVDKLKCGIIVSRSDLLSWKGLSFFQ